MTNKEIWLRMTDENGKKEPNQAYHYFTEYLNMGADRSLAKLCRKLGKKPGYVGQLEKYSSRWNWVARVGAYEDKVSRDILRRNEEFFESFTEQQRDILNYRLNVLNENYKNIREDGKLSDASKSKAYVSNSKAYSTNLESLLTVLGKPKEYSNQQVTADYAVTGDTSLNVLFDDDKIRKIIDERKTSK